MECGNQGWNEGGRAGAGEGGDQDSERVEWRRGLQRKCSAVLVRVVQVRRCAREEAVQHGRSVPRARAILLTPHFARKRIPNERTVFPRLFASSRFPAALSRSSMAPSRMLAQVYRGTPALQLEEVDVPPLEKGEVRVRVSYCGASTEVESRARLS